MAQQRLCRPICPPGNFQRQDRLHAALCVHENTRQVGLDQRSHRAKFSYLQSLHALFYSVEVSPSPGVDPEQKDQQRRIPTKPHQNYLYRSSALRRLRHEREWVSLRHHFCPFYLFSGLNRPLGLVRASDHERTSSLTFHQYAISPVASRQILIVRSSLGNSLQRSESLMRFSTHLILMGQI